MLHLISVIIIWGMQWSHCSCFWYHLMLTPMPVASQDGDTDVNGVRWPKFHAAPHFDHLDLRKSVMPLTMSLASCDTNSNCVKWPKKSCCMSFQSSWPKECMLVLIMPVPILMASHDQKCDAVPHISFLDLKNSMVVLRSCWLQMLPVPVPMASYEQNCISFCLSCPKELNGAIDDIIGIMWCQHLHQWSCWVMKNFLWHLFILTWRMPSDTPNSITGHTDLLLSGESSLPKI